MQGIVGQLHGSRHTLGGRRAGRVSRRCLDGGVA